MASFWKLENWSEGSLKMTANLQKSSLGWPLFSFKGILSLKTAPHDNFARNTFHNTF
jgi:hypothetical protein